jgi:hypothetical protein
MGVMDGGGGGVMDGGVGVGVVGLGGARSLEVRVLGPHWFSLCLRLGPVK